MKTILYISFTALIILAFGATDSCYGDSIVDDINTIGGNVVSVDSQNSKIVVKTSEGMTFYIPSGAKIVNADGYDMRLSDVNAGNYVTVDYHEDKSGHHVIKGMQVKYKR